MTVQYCFCNKLWFGFSSFGTTTSVIHECVTNVCALITELESQYVKWPDADELLHHEATFRSWSGKV
jgi:hypothetical protein